MTQSNGLVIRLGTGELSTRSAERRLRAALHRVLLSAVESPDTPYGEALRRTATVTLLFPSGREKRIQTVVRPTGDGVLTRRALTAEDAWRLTAERAEHVLRGLADYVVFCRKLDRAAADPAKAVPPVPSMGGILAYAKALWGDHYFALHKAVTAQRAGEVYAAAPAVEALAPAEPTRQALLAKADSLEAELRATMAALRQQQQTTVGPASP